MHEVGIAENILCIVKDVAQKQNLRYIKKVVLEIGQFSGVVPALLRFALEWACRDSIMEKTEIEVISPALRLCCQHCKTEYSADMEDLRCPVCKGEDFDTLQGREMLVKAIIGG